MRSWQKRLLLTLAVLVLLELGDRIPLPGIRLRGLDGLGGPQTFSILALGIMPYLSAAALTMLFSGLISPLRRLRDGELPGRRRFDLIVMSLTALLGLMQGFGSSIGLAHSIHATQGQLLTGQALFQVLCAVTLAAGAMLTAALAQLITRRGLGNGIAVILVAGYGMRALKLLREEFRTTQLPLPHSHHWLGLILFTLALLLLLAAWLRVHRPLRLLDESGAVALEAPLRPNLTGALPLFATGAVLGLLVSIPVLGRFFWDPAGPWWTWATRLVLVALINLLLTVWLLDPGDLRRRAARWGLKVEGKAGDGEINRLLMRHYWPQTLILWLLVLSRPLAGTIVNLRPETTYLYGARFMVALALILEFWRAARARGAVEDDDWMPMLESRVKIEPEMARVRLAQAGVEARVVDDRCIGVTGSLAPWEISKPRFPAFFNYPYLGGGRVRLLVPPAQVAAAEQELDRWPREEIPSSS